METQLSTRLNLIRTNNGITFRFSADNCEFTQITFYMRPVYIYLQSTSTLSETNNNV